MRGVQPLPLELVLEIMLYLFIDVRGRPHKQFGALSRVCKMWKPYAQRLLFRNVRILQPEAALGFMQATRLDGDNEDARRLGGAVRTLDMTIMSKEMISLLPFVLRHCSKLYEFSVSFYTNMDLDTVLRPPSPPPTFKIANLIDYSKIPLPQINALRISCNTNPSDLPQKLLQIWPNVRHLVVSGQALEELCLNPRTLPKDLERSNNLQLCEFQTGRVSTRSAPITAKTFRAFLMNSIGILKVLDLYGISDGIIALSEPLFVEHGPHLRSLRLPNISLSVKLPFLKRCTELEEIAVYGYPPKTVCINLPGEKICHAYFITMQNQTGESPSSRLQWLATLPCLAVLTWSIRGPKDAMYEKHIGEIRKFCTKKGVRLREASLFDLEEELIEPSSFPRDEIMTALWR